MSKLFYLCVCPFEGEIFKPCGTSCRQNCTSVQQKKQIIFLLVCLPGCDCPVKVKFITKEVLA